MQRRSSAPVRRVALLAAAMGWVVVGCSSTAAVPDPSPSRDAPVLEVPAGTESIDVAVGQSVDFQVGTQSGGPTTEWRARTSDATVFQVIEPSDDLLSPETPGGLAKATGSAVVSLVPPDTGQVWKVRVTVAAG